MTDFGCGVCGVEKFQKSSLAGREVRNDERQRREQKAAPCRDVATVLGVSAMISCDPSAFPTHGPPAGR